jgi:plasmid stability protein
MKTIVVPLPDHLKQKLDHLRAKRGYSINAYVRSVLTAALRTVPSGPVVLRYRKPGGAWRARTVPERQLTRTILKLEDEGAEILR